MNINWHQGSNNSLTCNIFSCQYTPYPPPIDDNTSYTISCLEDYSCYGTILTCPRFAACNIKCYGPNSCRDSIIYCPSTAKCNLECIDNLACRRSRVYWSSNPELANLTCNVGESRRCDSTQNPVTIDQTTTSIWVSSKAQ